MENKHNKTFIKGKVIIKNEVCRNTKLYLLYTAITLYDIKITTNKWYRTYCIDIDISMKVKNNIDGFSVHYHYNEFSVTYDNSKQMIETKLNVKY